MGNGLWCPGSRLLWAIGEDDPCHAYMMGAPMRKDHQLEYAGALAHARVPLRVEQAQEVPFRGIVRPGAGQIRRLDTHEGASLPGGVPRLNTAAAHATPATGAVIG